MTMLRLRSDRNPTLRYLKYIRSPLIKHRLRHTDMIGIEIIYHISASQKCIAHDRR